jgi:putative methionine-R-sulfoxide reductase with GAF domain
MYNNKVLAVLDADSQFLNHFDDIDTHYLEKLTSFIAKFMVKEQSN